MKVTFTVSILALHRYTEFQVECESGCDPVAKKKNKANNNEMNRNIYKTHGSAQKW